MSYFLKVYNNLLVLSVHVSSPITEEGILKRVSVSIFKISK
jgi:hypothetical protein